MCCFPRGQPAPLVEWGIGMRKVYMLKLSAIQNPTKFHAPHWRRAGSTGFRSWFVNYIGERQSALSGDAERASSREGRGGRHTISCVVVRPGSASTASLSTHRLVVDSNFSGISVSYLSRHRWGFGRCVEERKLASWDTRESGFYRVIADCWCRGAPPMLVVSGAGWKMTRCDSLVTA